VFSERPIDKAISRPCPAARSFFTSIGEPQTMPATQAHVSTSTSKPHQRHIPSLDEIADAAFTSVKGNRAEATTIMTEHLYGLYNEASIRDALIDLAAVIKIGERIRSKRARAWNAPPAPPPAHATPEANRRRFKIIAAVNRSTLWDFALSDGTKLGDSSKAQILADANSYLKRGRDELVKGRWLKAVADAMDDKQTARQALRLNQLKALRKQAEASV
jgi:hypothetical protein